MPGLEMVNKGHNPVGFPSEKKNNTLPLHDIESI